MPSPNTDNAKRPRIAIIGGGVAGLTAAHELAKLGKFDITVFEKRGRGDSPGGGADGVAREVLGGKAWSYSADKGNFKVAPPAEHGFRFFPGFYYHVIETMKDIPVGDSNVADYHLVNAKNCALVSGSHGGQTVQIDVPVTTEAERNNPLTMMRLLRPTVSSVRKNWRSLPSLTDSMLFASYLFQFATSCPERREKQWEKRSWWDYIEAWDNSAEYQKWFAVGLTRSFVATRAEDMDTRTGGTILLQLLYDMIPLPTNRQPADRLLDAPTSVAWIGPWYDYLIAPRREVRDGQGDLRASGRRRRGFSHHSRFQADAWRGSRAI